MEAENQADAPRSRCQLKSLREAAGLSARELAARIGVSPKTVQSWESGHRSLRAEMIVKISACLGCTPNDILGYDGEGPLRGRLRALSPEMEEVVDLYLDNDLTMQHTIKQILYTNARPRRRGRRHP